MKTYIRTAHGVGADAVERVEVPPVDEGAFPSANGAPTDTAVTVVGGRFPENNRAAAGRKPALARLGVECPDTADPRYKSALRSAKRYCDTRRRELAALCGGTLGAGPSAMLASSALALAASRYLYGLAAGSGDPGLFLQAARLADMARTQELTAEAIAIRAAQASVEDDATRVRRERLETSRRRLP